MTADLVAVLDAEGIDRVTAWGYSRGGWLACNLAPAIPRWVDHIVVGAYAMHAHEEEADRLLPPLADFFRRGDWSGLWQALGVTDRGLQEMFEPAMTRWRWPPRSRALASYAIHRPRRLVAGHVLRGFRGWIVPMCVLMRRLSMRQLTSSRARPHRFVLRSADRCSRSSPRASALRPTRILRRSYSCRKSVTSAPCQLLTTSPTRSRRCRATTRPRPGPRRGLSREGAGWAEDDLHRSASSPARRGPAVGWARRPQPAGPAHPRPLRQPGRRGRVRPRLPRADDDAIDHGLHAAPWADDRPGAHVARAAKIPLWSPRPGTSARSR